MSGTENKILLDETKETHHHHSHHHHHHQKNGKKNKFKYFFRHNKKRIRYIAVIFVLVIALIVTALFLDYEKKYKGAAGEDKNIVVTNDSIQIEIPFYTEAVSLISPAVNEYLNSDLSSGAAGFYKKYEKNGGRADIGLPMEFCYNIKGIPEGYSVSGSKILISESFSLENSMVYVPKNNSKSVYIYNLKTGTQYYYRIELTLSDGSVTSAQGSFKTAATPRMLNIEGAVNVRDIGGWKTESGKTVRQGLLIRGSEIDGAIDSDFFIKKEGIKELVTNLGVRTEMDLRSPTDNEESTHPLGDNVKHIYYGVHMYTDAFSGQGITALKNVFSDLADSSNYPVYMHCTYGMDRTGTVCYLLGALLGVDKQDLMQEYQLSAFYYGSVNDEEMTAFIARLETYSGNNTMEKAESFLLSIGVTPQEIASIRSIFLS